MPSETAAAAPPDARDDESSAPKFECYICLDVPTDPVLTSCGHLYCWPCIYEWMQTKGSAASCPVCKSVISPDRVIPMYGKGSSADPREKEAKKEEENAKTHPIPPRPAAEQEPAPNNANIPFNPFAPFFGGGGGGGGGGNMQGGGNVQFMAGGFGFFPLFGAFQWGANGGGTPQEPETTQQFLARLFMMMGFLILFLVINFG